MYIQFQFLGNFCYNFHVIDQKLTMFETLAHACTNAHCIGRYLAFLALIVCFLIKSRLNFCKMPNIQLFSEIVGRVVGNQSRTRFIGLVKPRAPFVRASSEYEHQISSIFEYQAPSSILILHNVL